MAVWRTCTSCGAGLPGSNSSTRRTSGPPCSWKRMATGIAPRIAVARAARLPKLERGVVGLAGTDADDALDVGDEDLAVAPLAGLGRFDDGLDHLVHQIAAHRDLDAGLGHEVDHVLGAAVELGVSALAPEALDLRDRHARDTDVRERGTPVVELEGLNDRGDQFHEASPWDSDSRREGFCSFHASESNAAKTRARASGHLRHLPAAAPRWGISGRPSLPAGAPGRRASLGYPSRRCTRTS